MPSRHRIVVSLVAAALLTAPVAHAQRQFGPDPSRRDPKQGVYVRDSAVAGEKLALAQRMERLKEWDKAADVYQEIIEKYADRVVPVVSAEAGADETAAQRFTSVTMRVQELLGKWPDEGLARYRARYGTTAAGPLESAGAGGGAAVRRGLQA